MVDSKTIQSKITEDKKIIIMWPSPRQFCGRIEYHLHSKTQYLGRVTKLPCILDVKKFIGMGKLPLSIQVVLDSSYSLKVDKITCVDVGVTSISKDNIEMKEEKKMEMIEVTFEYENKLKQNKKINGKMGYKEFVQMIAQPLEIAKGIEDINKLETLLRPVFSSSSSNTFDGKKFFHIKNENSWKCFWDHFQFILPSLSDFKCLVYIQPQITQIQLNSENEAVVEFLKLGDRGKFDFEVELSFEKGDPRHVFYSCEDWPAILPLPTSATMDTTYARGIVFCRFRMRNSAPPEFDFGPWSKPIQYFNFSK